MMRWFDRWFARKCKWAWDNRDIADIAVTPSTAINKLSGLSIVEEDSTPWSEGLRINVRKMIGGYVVCFRFYDRKTDRSEDRNYIITDEQDFNAELGKMITMESMRQS
jgi:hypothetical protein